MPKKRLTFGIIVKVCKGEQDMVDLTRDMNGKWILDDDCAIQQGMTAADLRELATALDALNTKPFPIVLG